MGGWIVDTLDWRWVFWVNVPFGLLGTVLAWFIVPETSAGKPGGLFNKWAFACGNLVSLFANIILFDLFFLMPFAFERVFGESAFSAGLRLTTIPIALGVLAPHQRSAVRSHR